MSAKRRPGGKSSRDKTVFYSGTDYNGTEKKILKYEIHKNPDNSINRGRRLEGKSGRRVNPCKAEL